MKSVFTAVLFALTICPVPADEFRVAVASNFSTTLTQLANQFEMETGHRALISPGATGKQYAQIIQGAPFDAYFAADDERPARLEKNQHGVPGTRFTYAIGRLVLWSPDSNQVDDQGAVLRSDRFRHLAIANPTLAPYGRAARDVLQQLGLWQSLSPKLVRGENINQAFQFVVTGNAQLGFVAQSQINQWNAGDAGSSWDVPPELYDPIEQQAILLTTNQAAAAFLEFVRNDAALQIIRDSGYKVP